MCRRAELARRHATVRGCARLATRQERVGWTFHGNRDAFERERAKDRDLRAQGYAVIRVTWRAVTRDEMGVVARLAAVLAVRTPHREPTHPPAGG